MVEVRPLHAPSRNGLQTGGDWDEVFNAAESILYMISC